MRNRLIELPEQRSVSRLPGVSRNTPLLEAGFLEPTVVGQDQVPPVEAVLAAIGDVVARQPHAVFTRVCQQVAAATAVHTDDDPLGFQCDTAARYTVRRCQ